MYKDKLAVQLPSKIVIYELSNPSDEYDMHYQVRTCCALHEGCWCSPVPGCNCLRMHMGCPLDTSNLPPPPTLLPSSHLFTNKPTHARCS